MNEFVAQFLTVVLGSGAAIAIIRIAFDKQKEKRERADAVKYLAIQLAFQYEAFALVCEGIVSANQAADEYRGDIGRSIRGVPKPPALPVSDAYRFLEPGLLNLIFGFSQRCDMAQRMAEFYGEYVDSDSYAASAEENTVVMGSEALDIARTTRQKYRLGQRQLEFDRWNIEAFFEKELAVVKEKKADRQKAIEKREKPEGD